MDITSDHLDLDLDLTHLIGLDITSDHREFYFSWIWIHLIGLVDPGIHPIKNNSKSRYNMVSSRT